jgi:hypothetical protein
MPFEKGQSGNPDGPKDKAGMTSLARKEGLKTIARLVKELENEDPNIAIKAAKILLDRDLVSRGKMSLWLVMRPNRWLEFPSSSCNQAELIGQSRTLFH